MDTGDARIKVTVQQVPGYESHTSRSPSRRSVSRTTTVPLRTGESSARRMRQPTPAAHIDSSVSEIVRRNSRKRKSNSGTTVDGSGRRSNRKFRRSARESNEHAIEEEHGAMYSEQSVPSSEIRRRRSLYPMRNQRYPRLSAARDDLDDALQAAIGGTSVASSSDVDQDEYLASDVAGAGAAGELTTANEDFTMITGESLASISFRASGRMVGDVSHVDDDDDEEMEDVRVEHLTSSPPRKDLYPDITERAEEAKTPVPDGNEHAMEWKYTEHKASQHDSPQARIVEAIDGSLEDVMDSTEVVIEGEEAPVVERSSPASQSHVYHHSPTPQPIASKTPNEQEAITGASNPADEEVGEADDDIWAEEASRDIDDSAVTTTSTTSRAQHSLRTRVPRDQVPNTTNDAPSIFSEQPDPPRRAKLPRTWRQTSGVDLSYNDSPAKPEKGDKAATHHIETSHHQPEARAAQRASGDEAESGRSSGVLTPPTTDDDDSGRKLAERGLRDQGTSKDRAIEIQEEDEDEDEDEDEEVDDAGSNHDGEEDISGFTNAGAADTQLEAHHKFGRQHNFVDEDDDDDDQEEVASAHSDSGSGEETPGESGEDTGFFWQSNMPQVYRSGREKPKPQKKKDVDLSDILRMDSSKVEDAEPAKSHQPQASNASRSYSRQAPNKMTFSVHRKPAVVAARPNRPEMSPNAAKGNILPSPLRRSLLRTSKAFDNGDAVSRKMTRDIIPQEPESRVEEIQLTVTDDSLASKASDERQLLDEIRATTPVAKRPAHERLAILREDSHASRSDVEADNASYEETETTFKNSWPEQSYEENLNKESPQKIGVNFNDSTLSFQQQQQQQHPQPKADLLAPRGPIKPLFEKSVNPPIPKPSFSIPAPQKQHLSPSSPSITLASYKPQTAPQQENEGVLNRLSTTFWSAITRSNGPPPTPAPHARTTEQTISLSLRAQLRSRYGVLPNSHPWTMLHMRTLHRMLNSVESGRRDSIVPTHAPLPAHLRDIVDEGRLSATGRSFRFEKPHASVVQAFMQLLVAPSLFESMERGEVGWLGDAQAEHLRGEMGGRLGSEICFKTLKPGRGLIGWEWVVECLGCCVVSNFETGARRVEVERVGTVRDVEMSIMGDGEGDGRVREWFERESRGSVV